MIFKFTHTTNLLSETRRDKIKRLRTENPDMTLQAIGTQVGCTRERVRQILKSEGLPTSTHSPKSYICRDCGKHIRPNAERCGPCFKASRRVTVSCNFCGKEKIVGQGDINSHRVGRGYTNGLWYCNRECYSSDRQKARKGDRVQVRLPHHMNHQAVVTQDLKRFPFGRTYILQCECGRTLRDTGPNIEQIHAQA